MPINILRLDERTSNVFILIGEEIEIEGLESRVSGIKNVLTALKLLY